MRRSHGSIRNCPHVEPLVDEPTAQRICDDLFHRHNRNFWPEYFNPFTFEGAAKISAKITIMADHGDAFDWNETGTNIGVSVYFLESPAVAKIAEDLLQWFGDFWQS